MTKHTTDQLQDYIISLLTAHSGKSLEELSQDNCSEISRLAAAWLLDHGVVAPIYILKGTGPILGKQVDHDVLVAQIDEGLMIIDPTIWQFRPQEKDMLILSVTGLNEAMSKLVQYYGGRWEISETIRSVSKQDVVAWLDVVNRNIAL